MAGTIGAIFNGALQLGSAVGIAAVSSIETSVEEKNGDPKGYAGRAAAFWFLLGIIGVEIISLLVFYRVEAEHMSPNKTQVAADEEKGKVEVEDEKARVETSEGDSPVTESPLEDSDDFKKVNVQEGDYEIREEFIG